MEIAFNVKYFHRSMHNRIFAFTYSIYFRFNLSFLEHRSQSLLWKHVFCFAWFYGIQFDSFSRCVNGNALIGFEIKGVYNVPTPDLYWKSSSGPDVNNSRSAFAKLFTYKNDDEEYSTQDSDEEEDSS